MNLTEVKNPDKMVSRNAIALKPYTQRQHEADNQRLLSKVKDHPESQLDEMMTNRIVYLGANGQVVVS